MRRKIYLQALEHKDKIVATFITLGLLALSIIPFTLGPNINSAEPAYAQVKQPEYSVSFEPVERKADYPRVSRDTVRPVLPKPVVKPVVKKPKPKPKPKVHKPRIQKPHRPHKVFMSAVAKCIGKWESDNNPKAENPYSTASGYFQFVDGTWNNYMGYRRAKYAPLSVQLQKFYIVWDGGRGAYNWVTAYHCGY